MSGTGRPAGRPRTSVLNRELITETARTIIEKSGAQALTMTVLARKLSVTPSALYNHAASKHEILRWIEDAVMSEIDVDAFDSRPWPEALEEWARSYRDVLLANHELLVPVATTEVSHSPHSIAMYERVTRALGDAGWPVDECLPLIFSLESFIYGSALNAQAPEDVYDTGAFESAAPSFAAAVAAGSHNAEAFEELFRIGLRAIIAWNADRAGVPLPR
ncbi:TetR/AcrR family transcriptional regulator [Gulosibacter sp. 10]|uniref:TetR/AcrR family transcriptional regulator n=1 Tax=Gulosibacter sp. 10 TaxID=1255570 RepID=UPI00097EAA1E|nr:TetR/AcrR family transcriptional regulator C-terminal domain-containing protein [Gulosibacter sp. 10]SJM62925.1 Transcriptional regulator, TetR family [Gulosibacter sp. 10]